MIRGICGLQKRGGETNHEDPDKAKQVDAEGGEGIVKSMLGIVQQIILALEVPHEETDEQDEGKVDDESEQAVVAWNKKSSANGEISDDL